EAVRSRSPDTIYSDHRRILDGIVRPANKYSVLCATALCAVVASPAAQPGNLRVGAARFDITTSANAAPGLRNVWGTAFSGIHDRIYVRAIVIDNGQTGAALLSIDTSSMPDNLALRRRIEKETGIPAGKIMISTTHGH